MAGLQRVAVTGAAGFIGRNLVAALIARGDEVMPLVRSSSAGEWHDASARSDAVVHLAGVTQAPERAHFEAGNQATTDRVIASIEASGRPQAIIFASSVKAVSATAYGETKRDAETALLAFAQRSGSPLAIYRLPHVFGRWARPDYNSVVVTLCQRQATGAPFTVDNPDAPLRIASVDDVVASFVDTLNFPPTKPAFVEVAPIYQITVGRVAAIVEAFDSEQTVYGGSEDPGLVAALRKTYDSFSRRVP